MSRSRSALRRSTAALVLVLLVGLMTSIGPGTTHASAAGSPTEAEAAIARRLADARAEHGLPAVARSGDLDAVARDWARQQAADGRMHHNPELGEQVQPARAWYENVGHLGGVPSSRSYADGGARLHQMWMDSAGHRANILRTPLTDVGIGVASDGDAIYAAVVFRERDGAGGASPEPVEPDEPADPPASAAPAPSPSPTPEADEPAASTRSVEPSREPSAPEPVAEDVGSDPAPEETPTPEPERTSEPTGTPPQLAETLERRAGEGPEGGAVDDLPEPSESPTPAEAAGRPPVELEVVPEATGELSVGREGTRAVPLTFGLTTIAAAVVVGASRPRRDGR